MAVKGLSPAMHSMLARISGHKYGWTYISRRELPTADALERRGLVEYGVSHDRDHWDCPQVSATDAGLEWIKRWRPNSPAARRTYEEVTTDAKG